MNHQLIRVSKFLSLVLRHKPESIGLVLDDNGWANVDELIAAVNRAGVPLTLELLQQVVKENDKQRFAFSEDSQRIRASQGHSIRIDLGLEPIKPPDVLFHGTANRFLTSIRQQGLISRSRNHVHLSPDERTARSVGGRHGQPVVLIIDADRMHQHGHMFYRSANGVWLTEHVPIEYVTFPEI